MLRALAEDTARERISIGDMLTALGDRALGALLFVFAFPNMLPTPPGTSTVLGTPLIFLAAQLAFGLRPWLPAVIARRSLSRSDFAALVGRIGPWLARAERLLRPRATLLTVPPVENLVGLVCLLLALILVLPIPLGNMPPALAISLMALGILARDGLCVALGVLTAVVSVVIVWGVVWAMLAAAMFFLHKLFA